MKSLKRNNKGFSLIEILVAIAIISIAGTYVLNGFVQAARMNAQAQKVQRATDLGQVTVETFNGKSLAALLANYSTYIGSTAGTTIEIYKEDGTTLSKTLSNSDNSADGILADFKAAGDGYEVRITNLPQEAIADENSHYTIDLVLKSDKYGKVDSDPASFNKIQTTYDQNSKIRQVADPSDPASAKKMMLNNFIVPDIRETSQNLVISTNDYNDAEGIAQYKAYAADYYATQKASGVTLNHDIAYQAYYDECFNELSSNVFPDGTITSNHYPGAVSMYPSLQPTRKLTVNVTCYKNTGTSNTYGLQVTMDAIYTFGALTFNGITIPGKTIGRDGTTGASALPIPLISAADGMNFEFDITLDDAEIKRVYFYFNPIDQANSYYSEAAGLLDPGAAGRSSDTVTVNMVYDTTAVGSKTDASLMAKLKQSAFYLISQKFTKETDLDGDGVIDTYECIPLFGDTTMTTNNDFYASGFEVYTNLMKAMGASSYTWCSLVDDESHPLKYITDGNEGKVRAYDMNVIVKCDGREYANISTFKEE